MYLYDHIRGSIIPVLTAATIVSILAIANQVYAVSPYDSGYAHGASDAHKNPSNWYILQPGKGFAFHTKTFNDGYIAGFCANGGGGSDADQATFSCP
jgi:hypothetical protein